MAKYRPVRKPTSEASISQEVRASSAPKSAPLSSLQGRRADETTTKSAPKARQEPTASQQTETPSSEVADASLAEISAPLVEALGDAPAKPLTALAQKLGRTASHVRQCVRALKAKTDVANPGAYLRRLIEAPEGSVMPPAGPAHAKDQAAYRPIDVIAAPKPERLAWQAEQEAQKAREDAQRAAWEGLEESKRQELLQSALAEVLAEQLAPPVRKKIQAEGVAHRQVIALAKGKLTRSAQ